MKDVENGKYGIFDADGNLIKGFDLAEVLENGNKKYEIRSIDDNLTEQDLNFNDIKNKLE